MKLLNSDVFQLVLWKQLSEKLLKLLQLIRLTYALLASNQLIYPFVIALLRFIIIFHLIPNTLQSFYQNFYFITEFIDESQQIQYFSDYTVFVWFSFVVSDGQNNYFVYILFSQDLIQIFLSVLPYTNAFENTF